MSFCRPLVRLDSATALLAVGVAILFLGGCRTTPAPPRSPLPTARNLHHDRITLYRDVLLPTDQAMVDELALLRRSIETRLQLPANQTSVHIFVFADKGTQHQYLASRYPHLPQRRALFVQGDGHLKVFAHQGDRLREDLRHEITHATLHAAVEKVPLWLDEGLAEFFEVPPEDRGYHRLHAEALAKARDTLNWQPDIGRLESIHDARSMSQLDYAESWLWAHWLMSDAPSQNDLLLQCLGVHPSMAPIDSLWQALPRHQTPRELTASLPLRTR